MNEPEHSQMKHMDTVVDAITALEADGYRSQMVIADDGTIVAGDRSWSVEQISVDRTIRFEGMSNPDDEAMVMAVTTDDSRRGTLTVPYGPDVSGAQADTIRALATS